MNIIPARGRQHVQRHVLRGSFPNEAMQGEQLHASDLRDLGLRTPESIQQLCDVNPGSAARSGAIGSGSTPRRAIAAPTNYVAGSFVQPERRQPECLDLRAGPDAAGVNDADAEGWTARA